MLEKGENQLQLWFLIQLVKLEFDFVLILSWISVLSMYLSGDGAKMLWEMLLDKLAEAVAESTDSE